MGVFFYTALDKTNSYVKGKIEAKSTRKATVRLEKEGFLVINIKEEKTSRFTKINNLITGISAQDKIFFTRNLYTMLESGIPLDHAVKTAAEQTTNPKFKEILVDIHQRIQKGQTLHSVLLIHKKYFSNFFINLIKVGEMSGKLDNVLLHLLEQQEKDYDLRTKAIGALIYPLIIIFALIVMVIFMMVFVVPNITSVLTEYEVDLPLTTKVLIWLSNFLINYGLFLIPLVILIVFLLSKWTKTEKGKWKWDSFILSIPRIKKLIIEFNQARFARSMNALLKSGIPINQSLDLAAGVSNNSHYQKSIRGGINFVQKGIPMAEVLKGHPKLYPPLTTRMIELGEKTGKLDHMLNRLASFYERSVETTIANLSAVIEPALLISIGFAVAFVAISVLTPVWKYT